MRGVSYGLLNAFGRAMNMGLAHLWRVTDPQKRCMIVILCTIASLRMRMVGFGRRYRSEIRGKGMGKMLGKEINLHSGTIKKREYKK